MAAGPALSLLTKNEMNWIEYFNDFFAKLAGKISEILDAAGCRERWIQGELYLADRDLSIKTDAKRQRFDVFCESQPMIGEIKICGGDYSTKMEAQAKMLVGDGRVGVAGERDPACPCDEFEPGDPGGDCYGDGHYLCNECEKYKPLTDEETEDDDG